MVRRLRDRALLRAGDEPRLSLEAADRLERQRRSALVRDRDEDVGLRRVAEDDLERLRRGTAGERRVKRRAAAGEEHAGAFRKTTIADPLRHLLQPLGLRGDGLSGQLSGHEGCLYHRARWRSSRRRRSATEYASSRRPFHRSDRCRASSCSRPVRATRRPSRRASPTSPSTCSSRAPNAARRRATISTEIDAIGGEFNAFTGKELTGYYVRCGSETRDVALDVLADMLLHSRFDEDEIDEGEGRDRRGDERLPRHAAALRRERLRPTAVRAISRSAGTSSGRARPSRRRRARPSCRTSTRWYRPERMVVGIGGRIGDGLTERLEELLGGIEPRPTG